MMMAWWFPPHLSIEVSYLTFLFGLWRRKTDLTSVGYQRMTMDYHKLKDRLIPVTAVVPDRVWLFEQINTSSETQYAAINLHLFLYLCYRGHQKQLSFSLQDQQDIPTVLTHYPVLCHSLVCKYFGYTFLPLGITLIHYMDGVMLIGPRSSNYSRLVRHFCISRWEINPSNIQVSSISGKFLGLQWYKMFFL